MCSKRLGATLTFLAAVAAMPQVSSAQTPAAPPGERRVIVVTGERLPRPIDEVPVSVHVVYDSELEAQQDIDRLDRVLQQTPNVIVGSGSHGPTIRGQDTTGVLRDLAGFLGGSRPRATLVVDGRAASFNEFVFGTQPLWDVAQIEVFRSPQTTTQGQNAIAGAIFIETAAPSDQWQGRLRGLAGSFATSGLSASLAGPIVDDELTMRIAGDVRRGRTSTMLGTTARDIDPNRDDYHLVRLKLAARPRSFPELEIDTTLVVTGSQSPQIEGIRRPFRERRDLDARYGIFRSSLTALTIRPRVRLGSDTGLSAVLAIGSAEVRRFAPPGLGEARNAIEDRSLELLFNHGGDKASVAIGASGTLLRLGQDIDLTSLGTGKGDFTDEQLGLGLFGEAQLEVIPRLTLAAGARLQSDRQSRSGVLTAVAGTREIDFDRTYTSVSPKLSLAYRLDKDTRFGFLVQRAANPGGATFSASSGRLDSFDAESLWNYEFFLRGRSDRLGLMYSANLFHYQFRNAQRPVLRVIDTPGGPFFEQEIGNVAQAWSRGAELNLTWSPNTVIAVTGSIGLLDTRVTRTPAPSDPLLGKQFQRSPDFTGVVSVDWRPNRRLAVNLGYTRRAGYFSDDANTPELRIGAAEALSARAEWVAGHLRVFGFVRNVFDRFDLSYLFERGRLATAEDPREFGIGSEVRF
jgi:outer membrane receptor protein involved in Fe transport